jgi:hypothetical protein
MFLMTLQHIPDEDQPRELVASVLDAMLPGSSLVVSDTTRDVDTDRSGRATAQLNQRMGSIRLTRRSREAIAGYFDGLDLVDPGLVRMPEWRAEADPEHVIPCYAAVGRQP